MTPRHHAAVLVGLCVLLAAASAVAAPCTDVSRAVVFLRVKIGSATSHGAGTLVSSEGHVLTALHVVRNRAGDLPSHIAYTASDDAPAALATRLGSKATSQIVWIDPDRDLALLKVSPPPDDTTKTPCAAVATAAPPASFNARIVTTTGARFRIVAASFPARLMKSDERVFLKCDDGLSMACNQAPYATAAVFDAIAGDHFVERGYSGGPVFAESDDGASTLVGVITMRTSTMQFVASPAWGVPVDAPAPAVAVADTAPALTQAGWRQVVESLDSPPLAVRALLANRDCAPLEELAHAIEDLVEASEFWRLSAVGVSYDHAQAVDRIAKLEALIRTKADEMVGDPRCGRSAQYTAYLANALLYVMRIERSTGTIRTLWSATLASLVRAPNPARPAPVCVAPYRWTRAPGTRTWISPLEHELLCVMADIPPAGPAPAELAALAAVAREEISKTDFCAMERAVRQVGIAGPALVGCLDADAVLRWSRVVAKAKPGRTWLALAAQPQEQVDVWRAAVSEGLLDPVAVLARATGTSPRAIYRRIDLLQRDLDFLPVRTLFRDAARLATDTIRDDTNDTSGTSLLLARTVQDLPFGPIKFGAAPRAQEEIARDLLVLFVHSDTIAEVLAAPGEDMVTASLAGAAVVGKELRTRVIELILRAAYVP
ncbi:MAG TPA: serine protease [Kofleriaceae bacterium]|nr:serine protease [Kofleriaceae bacterium]